MNNVIPVETVETIDLRQINPNQLRYAKRFLEANRETADAHQD